MGIAESILQILAVGLEMTESYIDDPKRRLESRLKSKEKMRLKAVEIINEKDTKKVDQKLLDFLALLKSL